MTSEGISPADLAAVTNQNDGWGNSGSWFIWIILIFAIFGGGLWGNNGNNQNASSAEVQRGFDNQNVMMRFDSLGQNMSNASYENARLINQGMLDASNGFSQTQMAIMNTGNNMVNSMNNGFNSVNSGLAENRFTQQSCCCETNRNIDSLKYEGQINTTAITDAIHAEGELTRGLINANVVQDLRDRLEEKDRLYMAANYQISQAAQTQNILGNLGRFVPNPPYPYMYTGTTTA